MNPLELRKILWARATPRLQAIHPSHQHRWKPEGLSEERWDEVWTKPGVARYLTAQIQMGLRVPVEDDLRAVYWPLVLLDDAQRNRLELHLAAAMVASVVRTALSGDQVRRWRQWLGTDAHDFALHSAPLLPKFALSVPRVEAMTGLSADQLGQEVIRRATWSWPDSVRDRFWLCLPWPLSGTTGPGNADSVHVDPSVAARLTARVLNILEPSWCSSFEV